MVFFFRCFQLGVLIVVVLGSSLVFCYEFFIALYRSVVAAIK